MQVRYGGRMSLVLPALCPACILMENNSNKKVDQLPVRGLSVGIEPLKYQRLATLVQKRDCYEDGCFEFSYCSTLRNCDNIVLPAIPSARYLQSSKKVPSTRKIRNSTPSLSVTR